MIIEFLEMFLRNLLLNENHLLYNRALHISGMFQELEKVNIGPKKANIGEDKVNIEEIFTAKTASHVRKLQEELGAEAAFGRPDVQRVISLYSPTDAFRPLWYMNLPFISRPWTAYLRPRASYSFESAS